MSLAKLDVSFFRNIEKAQLNLVPGFNFFYGLNGAGKTSLLEAIYLLGYGRSFRTSFNNQLIQHNQPKLTVFAELENGIPIGIEKNQQSKTLIRVNSENQNSAAILAELLPIQLINPDGYKLLEEGPTYRRQFLNWGVFHVEQGFYLAWSRLQRALKQRNSALKEQGVSTYIKIWDEEIIQASELIHKMRLSYWDKFLPLFTEYQRALVPELDKLSLSYYPGWKNTASLAEQFESAFKKELIYKYTLFGAHRADIKIEIEGRDAAEVLSRGQQKLLAFALRLSQGELLFQERQRRCIYLIDDLAAELDRNKRNFVFKTLDKLCSQVFVSMVDTLEALQISGFDGKLFHVEQGTILQQ